MNDSRDRGARSGGLELLQLLAQVLQLLLQLLHGAVVALAHRLLVVAQDGDLGAARGTSGSRVQTNIVAFSRSLIFKLFEPNQARKYSFDFEIPF